mmetsp:Transcript_72953/g.169127  ORF Transcript_72953/g.169127 Transcript_72953/m.169127 type:complete len:246 (-) Transcript_72953:2252-2989(-)
MQTTSGPSMRKLPRASADGDPSSEARIAARGTDDELKCDGAFPVDPGSDRLEGLRRHLQWHVHHVAALQLDLGKSRQLLLHSPGPLWKEPNIELYHLYAPTFANILDSDDSVDVLAFAEALSVRHGEVYVVKDSVRQPMAKRKSWLDIMCIVPAVAKKQPLVVLHPRSLPRVPRIWNTANKPITQLPRPRHRQSTSWAKALAQEDVRQPSCRLLATKPGCENCGSVSEPRVQLLRAPHIEAHDSV